MSLIDSQSTEWKPRVETPTGSNDILKNLKKLTVGSGTNRFEVNAKDGLWLGGDTFATAKINMSFAGVLTASDVILTGGTISGISLTDIAAGSSPSIQGWTSDLTFSSTDHNTVAWAGGNIKLTDGTTFTITGGNTGDMSAITFIYLDTDVSITVLQTTTTAATAVGSNKILVAVADDVASGKDATFQAFGGQGGVKTLITADNIAANTITANEVLANTITAAEIAASTITATEMNVGTLSAISADLGTITAGTITSATYTSVALAGGSGRSLVIDGDASKNIKFYYNNVESGYIATSLHTSGEDEYMRIQAASGRSLRFRASKIEVNGDFMPDQDNQNTCGGSNNRWSDGRFEDINVDDIEVNNSFSGCGSISGCAYHEVNLLSEEQQADYKNDIINRGDEKRDKEKCYTDFAKGDVLCWGKDGLKLSDFDCAKCVIAVTGEKGMPVVLGAEPIKVVGRVARGSWLVTSTEPGFARAWTLDEDPPRGCVIGTALASSSGERTMVKAMIQKF